MGTGCRVPIRAVPDRTGLARAVPARTGLTPLLRRVPQHAAEGLLETRCSRSELTPGSALAYLYKLLIRPHVAEPVGV